MSSVVLGDLDVAYAEAGTSSGGRPVVFVHGLAEDKDSWTATQEALGELHTFAYDLRGHGSSTVGVPQGSLGQLGADLVAFLEQVSGPAVVVGFSLGGTIALWAAAERPDLVHGLVVLGTSSVVGRSAGDFYSRRIAQAANTSSDGFRDAIRDDTAAALTTEIGQLETITAWRLRAIGAGAGYANAARAMAALHAQPLTPRLTEVATHVDVVGATGDTFCPFKAAQILLEALPDANYHEISDAGHLMNIDNPGAVTDVLRATIIGRN